MLSLTLDDPYQPFFASFLTADAASVSISLELGLFFLLMALSALFSGAEVALLTLNTQDKIDLSTQQDKTSRRILYLLEHSAETITTILTLNTIANVTIAVLGAVMTDQIVEGFGFSKIWSFLIEVVILTYLLLIIAEVTPKMFAQRHAIAFSRAVAFPLYGFLKVLFPFVRPLARLTSRLDGRMKRSEAGLSTEDLKYLADIGEKHGTLEQMERDMIHSIADFSETSVREVMVSRVDMIAIPTSASIREGLDLILEHGYSRYPLYDGHLDNLVGLVYAKDLLPYLDAAELFETLTWKDVARSELFYVPESKKISDLLEEFQRKRLHLAIVIDEHGGTEGLVTMENVLEEIVGDIRDELDDEEEENPIQKLDDHVWLLSSRLHLDDLMELIERDLEPDENEEHIQTIAGLLLNALGDFPTEGQVIRIDEMEFTIRRIENHRIEEVVLRLHPPTEI